MGSGAVFLGQVCLPLSYAKEAYPAEQIRWIVYTKPGGGFDLLARSLAPYMKMYLKEISKGAKAGDMIIRNMPEAGGLKAYTTIYNAKPDGYTIGDFNSGSYSDSMFSKSEIDYRRYTYLVRTGVSYRVIVTHKNGFKSWEEMMKAGRERELKWAVGNFGHGAHISAILIKEFARVPARFIYFPGTAENINAVLRGDVHMAIVSEESANALIDAGEIKVLTVLSDASRYPDVPSIAQVGHPELAEPAKLHRLVIAPPNLPGEITDILVSTFKKIFNDKQFLAQAKKIGFAPDPVYAAEADRLAQSIFNYYDENMPIFKKYLT